MLMESRRAVASLPSTMHSCSTAAGWTSLLLRRYEHPAHVELYEAPPISDQLVVLVTAGSTTIESFARGTWRRGNHTPGRVAMTAPGEATRIRWYGSNTHETLHLFIPASTMHAARDDLRDTWSNAGTEPSMLSANDPVLSAMLVSLEQAAHDRLPDLYADSAAHFLARHVLTQHADRDRRATLGGEARRLRGVEEYMLANIANPITLDELAAVAGCTTFRLIRLCRTYWSETPFRRLTRLRMDLGRRLLRRTEHPIIAISLECGYGNPSHFATAFRRYVGVSPQAYRST